MTKRKIIINRKFQFNIAASFAAVSAAIMTIIIIILSAVLISNNLELEEIARNQQGLAGTQVEIFKTLIALSSSKNLKNYHISASMIEKDNINTETLLNQNNEKIQNITERNNSLIVMLIISAVIQSVIIFYLLMRRTHRISGPLFLLNRYIEDMKRGGYPEIRPLRIKDDFHDLFNNFRDLADMIRKKNTESVKGDADEK